MPTTSTTPATMPAGERSVSVTVMRMRVGRGSLPPVSLMTDMMRGRMKRMITRIDTPPRPRTMSG